MDVSVDLMEGEARPSRTSDLDPAEYLVVWAFRRWVTGLLDGRPAHWTLVDREMAHQLGVDAGRRVVVTLVRLIGLLQANACRSFVYHRPCCPCIGKDEAGLLSFLSLCQHGDWAAARAWAETVVGEAAVGDMLATGARLAELLKDRGAALPLRHAAEGTAETLMLH